MDEPAGEAPETVEEVEVGAGEIPAAAEEAPGLNVGLLAFLLAILGLVAASNVWLRRRAERENAASREAGGDEGGA